MIKLCRFCKREYNGDRNTRFCSNECRIKKSYVVVTCDYCKKDVLKLKCIMKNRLHIHCSILCRSINQKTYLKRQNNEKVDAYAKKLSLNQRGKNNPNFGNRWSDDLKKQMSESRKLGVKEGRIIAWNKNLKKENDKRIMNISNRVKELHANNFNFNWKGNHQSEYQKSVVSRLSKLRRMSPESKEKMRLAKLGKKASIETRRKMSELGKLRKWSDSQRLKMLNLVLPVKDTKPELEMQRILFELGIEFRKHVPIMCIEHSYPCDILIEKPFRVVIEVDGQYWHNYPVGREIDHLRTKELQEQGYVVLRFWANNKIDSIDEIKKDIIVSRLRAIGFDF